MEEEIIRSLAKMLGRDNVVDQRERYSRDALDASRAIARYKPKTPLAVVKASSEDDIIKVIRFANKHRVPVVPYGGGTGLMGGASTLKRGIVIDLKALDSIEINEDDLSVRAGAGVIIKDLDRVVRRYNLLFAHDPWSASYATVGGAISTNGVGYLAAGYGSMGDQVLGLDAIISGEKLEIKAALKSSGINLKDLLIGSEGIFGIITSATLRLYPLPEVEDVYAFEFSNFKEGFDAVRRLLKSNVKPVSLDLFESNKLDLDEETSRWLINEGGVKLYLVFHGFKEDVEAQYRRARNVISKSGGKELDEGVARYYWEHRYDIADNYINAKERKVKFDFINISIPAGRILEYDRICVEIASRYRVMVQGHGIWHFPEFYSINLLSNSNDRMLKAMNEMLEVADSMGSFEYCHGIGVKLSHMLKNDSYMKSVRKIKHTLDPNNIMNPGKVGMC